MSRIESYTRKEFPNVLFKRGVASSYYIKRWMKENPKDFYTENDVAEVGRNASQFEYRCDVENGLVSKPSFGGDSAEYTKATQAYREAHSYE